MTANKCGSRSINIAPVSSRKLDIRPLNKAVKNVSGIHVNVWRDVENLKFKVQITLTNTFELRRILLVLQQFFIIGNENA